MESFDSSSRAKSVATGYAMDTKKICLRFLHISARVMGLMAKADDGQDVAANQLQMDICGV